VKLGDEVATTGIIYSRHPLTVFEERIRSMLKRGNFPSVITSRDINRSVGKRVTIPGLIVTGKEVATKKHETMIFVSFEDSFSIFETVFFPAAFRKFSRILDEVGVYLVIGKVEEEYGAVSINVEELLRVNREKVR
jgi:error-prone DNA polymerase